MNLPGHILVGFFGQIVPRCRISIKDSLGAVLRGRIVRWEYVGVQLVGTVGAQAMAELGVGALQKVDLHGSPIAFVVPDFLAGRADRQ
jgi:hypothetical protein